MKTKFRILFLLTVISFASCENMFDYSTYVIDFDSENRNVNQTNLEKLLKKNTDDTISIAFTGDTHRFYDEFKGFVDAVNRENEIAPIDFVIHVGDIADFGLPQQYIWANSYLLDLDCPYFVGLGNHDLVGNGALAYSEMFGEYNFSFVYKQIKFIFINTNSREFGFNGNVPDISWLDAQLYPESNFSNAVVIFHVPPMDADFDSDLEESFHTTLSKYNNVICTVHGHLHGHEIYKPYADSITYVNVYSAELQKFNVLKIANGKFKVETFGF